MGRRGQLGACAVLSKGAWPGGAAQAHWVSAHGAAVGACAAAPRRRPAPPPAAVGEWPPSGTDAPRRGSAAAMADPAAQSPFVSSSSAPSEPAGPACTRHGTPACAGKSREEREAGPAGRGLLGPTWGIRGPKCGTWRRKCRIWGVSGGFCGVGEESEAFGGIDVGFGGEKRGFWGAGEENGGLEARIKGTDGRKWGPEDINTGFWGPDKECEAFGGSNVGTWGISVRFRAKRGGFGVQMRRLRPLGLE